MKFSEVVGHTQLQRRLIQTHQQGRTAHAQIFIGAEGSGALALALAYAQYLQCEQPQGEDSCGHCNACHKSSKHIHPDIHFSYPTIGTGKISTDFIKEWRAFIHQNPYPVINQWLEALDAENQQGNINKNECVDIVKKLSFKKMEGRYKVLILWLPEFLQKEGNRLLKLIEEPEPDTVFILVAEQEDKILNTIRSRCQAVRIPRLTDEDVIGYLRHQLHVPAERAQQCAYLAEGNLHKARTLAESNQSDFSGIWLKWIDRCESGQPHELVRFVNEMAEDKDRKWGRKDYGLFLQYGLHFLRETLIVKLGGGLETPRLLPAETSKAKTLAARLSLAVLHQWMELLDANIFYIERNAAPKPLFVSSSIQLHRWLGA